MVRSSISPLLLAYAQIVTAVTYPPISGIIAFGDQFADAGNGSWAITGGMFPPTTSRYWQHHFTDGRTWVEGVAQRFGLPLTSYAVGGATTVNNMVIRGTTGGQGRQVVVPSLLDQVNTFVAKNTLTSAAASKVIWVFSAGINNAYQSLSVDTGPGAAVTDVLDAVSKIRAIGGTKFLVATVPIRGIRTPGVAYTATQELEKLAGFALGFSTALAIRLKYSDGFGVGKVDLYDALQTMQLASTKDAFDPAKNALSCVMGTYSRVKGTPLGTVVTCPLNDEAKYIWFDEFNPTARVHQMFAFLASRVITDKGWFPQ